MTVPMWMPFALLTALCAAYPIPGWVRRVDWFVVSAWTLLGVFCGAFWFAVVLFGMWIA